KARRSEDCFNLLLFRLIAVDLMRERLLFLRQAFSFMELETTCGPGRVDTFNPAKALLDFPTDKLAPEERVGVCDLPSVWNQKKREHMWLHWDGNNDRLTERDRSAAFGTGATPPTLDRDSLARMEDWIGSATPPG